MKGRSLLVSLFVNGVTAVFAVVPRVHGYGLLPYLVPRPVLAACWLVFLVAVVCGWAGLDLRGYCAGALVIGLLVSLFSFLLEWVYLNPLGRQDVGPTFGSFLAEAATTWRTMLFLLPAAVVLSLSAMGHGLGGLTRRVVPALRRSRPA